MDLFFLLLYVFAGLVTLSWVREELFDSGADRAVCLSVALVLLWPIFFLFVGFHFLHWFFVDRHRLPRYMVVIRVGASTEKTEDDLIRFFQTNGFVIQAMGSGIDGFKFLLEGNEKSIEAARKVAWISRVGDARRVQ